MLSRRKFLASISAAAAITVAKANIPLAALESGALIDEQPAWMPEGFVLPRGQTISRLMYPNLFRAIGTVYGGGPTTFNLPDFGPNVGNIKTIMSVDTKHPTPAGYLSSYFVPEAA